MVAIVELLEWPQSSAYQSLYYIMIEFHTNIDSRDQTSQLSSIYSVQYVPWMVQCNDSKHTYQQSLERFSEIHEIFNRQINDLWADVRLA